MTPSATPARRASTGRCFREVGAEGRVRGRAGAAQHSQRAEHPGRGRGEDPQRRAVPRQRGDRQRGGRLAGAAPADAALLRHRREAAVLFERHADVAEAVRGEN